MAAFVPGTDDPTLTRFAELPVRVSVPDTVCVPAASRLRVLPPAAQVRSLNALEPLMFRVPVPATSTSPLLCVNVPDCVHVTPAPETVVVPLVAV